MYTSCAGSLQTYLRMDTILLSACKRVSKPSANPQRCTPAQTEESAQSAESRQLAEGTAGGSKEQGGRCISDTESSKGSMPVPESAPTHQVHNGDKPLHTHWVPLDAPIYAQTSPPSLTPHLRRPLHACMRRPWYEDPPEGSGNRRRHVLDLWLIRRRRRQYQTRNYPCTWTTASGFASAPTVRGHSSTTTKLKPPSALYRGGRAFASAPRLSARHRGPSWEPLASPPAAELSEWDFEHRGFRDPRPAKVAMQAAS